MPPRKKPRDANDLVQALRAQAWEAKRALEQTRDDAKKQITHWTGVHDKAESNLKLLEGLAAAGPARRGGGAPKGTPSVRKGKLGVTALTLIDALRAHPARTSQNLVDLTRLDKAKVANTLARLKRTGLIKSDNGLYSLDTNAPPPTPAPEPTHAH